MWISVSVLLSLVAAARGRSFDALQPPAGTAVSQIANQTYGVASGSEGLTSIFSPRMDFEQWKPLTGRGDPLRNDPTYDYEPPVLDRVHYWADEARAPERKSEVLMLGVSSRKPSAAPHQPPLSPPPRHPVPRPSPHPTPNKYEDFTYKLSAHYPMTILVPPPPPPAGHQPALFGPPDDNPSVVVNAPLPMAPPPVAPSKAPKVTLSDTTMLPEHLSSFYALQESNLIYQSSTTQHWVTDQTKSAADGVSSDYAGWGPTTPLQDADLANETHNLISNDHIELLHHPYAFYKPMFSEAPPLPQKVVGPVTESTFLPTVLPPTPALETDATPTEATQLLDVPTERTTQVLDVPTDTPLVTTTERNSPALQQTPLTTSAPNTETKVFDMLSPMMSMPLVNGPERLEDNLYAYASENIQVFNENTGYDSQIESMQSMQPPKQPESSPTPQKQKLFYVNAQASSRNPGLYTHGPYLHARFTTPVPTALDESATEPIVAPMYLIIQGHSKVKTYGSKPKVATTKDTISNEIPKPVLTDEVKHLHTKKSAKKLDTTDVNRKSRAKNLQSLLDHGYGSIEIQETDLGIKYDVSDGSDVPVEIYRKGIVDTEHTGLLPASAGHVRVKRQIELEDLLPFDEEDIEDYIYKFLESKKNDTGLTGLIAQAVTSDAASAVDDLEGDVDILDEER